MAGSSTSAALRRMVDTYRGTVVGDEQDCAGNQDLTSSYIKILNQGFQRGKPVIICNMGSDSREPQMFDVFGPKIVVTRTKFNDDAVESRFLTIQMRARRRDDIPLNLPRQEFDHCALVLRNKLLKYRLDNYHLVKLDASLQVEGISDRLNQIGIPLLSTINSDDGRRKVVTSLKAIHQKIIEEQSNSMNGVIVEYLDTEWTNHKCYVYIKKLTTHLKVAAQHLEEGQINEKKVGLIVRNQLGFETKRLNDGTVIPRNRRRLNELKKRFHVGSD